MMDKKKAEFFKNEYQDQNYSSSILLNSLLLESSISCLLFNNKTNASKLTIDGVLGSQHYFHNTIEDKGTSKKDKDKESIIFGPLLPPELIFFLLLLLHLKQPCSFVQSCCPLIHFPSSETCPKSLGSTLPPRTNCIYELFSE